MTTPRTLSLLLASLALLVSGCAEDDPVPKIADPTPTASGSPSQDAGEAAAKESPEEFIQRWSDLDQEMQNSGRTAEYAAITRSCEPCEALVQIVETYYANGGYIKWPGREISRTRKIAPLAYEVWVNSSPTTYKKSAGGKAKTLDGGRSKYRLNLKRVDGQLALAEMVELPS